LAHGTLNTRKWGTLRKAEPIGEVDGIDDREEPDEQEATAESADADEEEAEHRDERALNI
jgi:hypothetical protein